MRVKLFVPDHVTTISPVAPLVPQAVAIPECGLEPSAVTLTVAVTPPTVTEESVTVVPAPSAATWMHLDPEAAPRSALENVYELASVVSAAESIKLIVTSSVPPAPNPMS